MSTWIVMTASAAMPQSCKGTYRRVALVHLTQNYTANNRRPAMISERARGVLQVIDMGKHWVGKTERCAYARACKEAERRALQLNTAAPAAHGDLLLTWGGSA